jgi:hypothetical protein
MCSWAGRVVWDETGDRGAEMGRRVVPELGDEGMAVERLLHAAALDAPSTAVDEAHVGEPGAGCCVDVFGDHGRHVRGIEGVQIDLALDG